MKTKEETTEGFWDGTFVDSPNLNILIWISIIIASLPIIFYIGLYPKYKSLYNTELSKN